MRYVILVSTWLLIPGASVTALAEEPELEKLECPAPFQKSRVDTYSHDHEVLVVAEPQPTAIVKDKLEVTGRNGDLLCFGLSTVARNYHQCGFVGVARSESQGTYIFRDRDVVLRFEFLGDDRVRVEAVGEGYRTGHCGTSGEVETAIYTLQKMEANNALEQNARPAASVRRKGC